MVEQLGKGLGKTVGERLDHDRAIGIVRRVQFRREFVRAMDADDKPAEVVVAVVCSPATQSASARLGLPDSLWSLLAQGVEPAAFAVARFIRPDDDVIAVRVGREKPVNAAGVETVRRR